MDALASKAHDLFLIKTSEGDFVRTIRQLQQEDFDFNELRYENSKLWSIGTQAITKGDAAVTALADAGYRFDRDYIAMNYAETAYHGSRNRAVCLAAQRHNRWIEAPSEVQDALSKEMEKLKPSHDGDFGVALDPVSKPVFSPTVPGFSVITIFRAYYVS